MGELGGGEDAAGKTMQVAGWASGEDGSEAREVEEVDAD